MSDNIDETNQQINAEINAENQGGSPLQDVKKKLFDELDTINLGELTESEIKTLSDMLSPYLKDKASTPPAKNASTPPAKNASTDGTTLQEPGMTVRKNNYYYYKMISVILFMFIVTLN